MDKIAQLIKNNVAIKAGLGYIIGNFLTKGIVFFTIPIFTRLMNPEQFGIYSVYMTYELILVAIVGVSAHTSIRNAFYDYKDDFVRFVSSLIGLTITGGLVLTLIFTVIYKQIAANVELPVELLFLLVFHCTSDSLMYIYNAYLSLSYDYRRYQFISFMYCCCNIGLSYYLIKKVFILNTSMGRAYGTAIPLIIVGIWIVFQCFKKSKHFYNIGYWHYALVYSLPLIPHALSQVLLTHFNRIVIQKYFDNIATGLFSFSAIFNNVILVIVNSLSYSYNTWFYENMEKNNFEDIKKASKFYVYGFSIFVSILILSAKEMTTLLAPIEYQDSIYCTIPLLLSAFFSAIYTLPSQVEYYFKKTKFISYGTLFATVLNMVLSVVCVPKYGYISAAYINLFTSIVYFALHYYFAFGIKKRCFFDTKATILSSFICMGVAIWSNVYLNHPYARFAILLVLVIVLIFAYLKNKDLKLMKR